MDNTNKTSDKYDFPVYKKEYDKIPPLLTNPKVVSTLSKEEIAQLENKTTEELWKMMNVDVDTVDYDVYKVWIKRHMAEMASKKLYRDR